MNSNNFFNKMIAEEKSKQRRLKILKRVFQDLEIDPQQCVEESFQELMQLSKEQIIRRFISNYELILFKITNGGGYEND